MRKQLPEKDIAIIETLYVKDGLSMKNIANYFVEIGRPIDESVISKHLNRNGLSRGKGGALNKRAIPSVETVYQMALRLISSTMASKAVNN